MIEDFQPSSTMTKAITNRTEEMLRNATLPDGLWTYAMKESVYKKNRAPTKALKFKKTPWEALYKTKPDLSKDNAWGARVYVTIPPELRISADSTKLHTPRAYIAHYLAADSEKICWVWHSDQRTVKRITIARINNSTGMNDPQPHGQHINNRDPRPEVTIPDTAIDSDDSENESDITDEKAGETSHFFPAAFSALPYFPSDTEEDNKDERASQPSLFFAAQANNRVLRHNITRSSAIQRHHRARRARLPNSPNPDPIVPAVSQQLATAARNARAPPSRITSPYFSTPNPATAALFLHDRRRIGQINVRPTPAVSQPRTVLVPFQPLPTTQIQLLHND
jgi:hypothetical protein